MRFLLIIALIIINPAIPAQSYSNTPQGTKAGDLYLSLRSINFLKNNEYSNPIIEGYTLTGYFLHPEIVYLPSEKVSLRLGAHLLSYSGTNKYSRIKPLYSLSYNLPGQKTFTIGSLQGSDTHLMFDPHFNKERLYNQYSEDGLQFTLNNDHIFSDTWLSWENYIFRGDNSREVFTAGESFRYTSSLVGKRLRFEIPVQLQVKHFGGQISNYPEPVETYINSAAGVRIASEINCKRAGKAGFEYLLFTGGELAGRALTGIKYGYANWFKLFCSLRKSEMEIGYWLSHDYYSPNGNFIFGSVSDYLDDKRITNRRILTLSANIDLSIESFLELYLGFDGYYDTRLNRFDHSLALHLRFDKLIKLANINR